MRKITYVSGTRADYGLMQETLRAIHEENNLTLSILVTGVHLLPQYGMTINEIQKDGFDISGRVSVNLSGDDGHEMASALAEQIKGFTNILSKNKPDILLLLGDRGEMLAAAITALHLNIVIAHIHGGELSGTIDESFRHAITKLSHYHFVSNKDAYKRVVKMGECESKVFITGAPGLDAIYKHGNLSNKKLLSKQHKLDVDKPIALVLFHPVVQHLYLAYEHTLNILNALKNQEVQAIILNPNSDAGGKEISRAYELHNDPINLRFVTHMKRDEFLKAMASVDIMIGNSSSGIIEAACFGTPVINIGIRQNMRLRNDNVYDSDTCKDDIIKKINSALRIGVINCENVYGDGNTSLRVVDLLRTIDINPNILEKCNAY